MEEKTVIITGGNSGLGYQCAKNIALNHSRYHVVLACRNLKKADEAADMLRKETHHANITAMKLDLASLSSIRMFYESFSVAKLPPLYGLVCNAGIGSDGVPGTPYTKDGFEMIFGVNHLGHFLLANLLLNKMESTGRIVFVSSNLHDPPAFFRAKELYDNATAISGRSPGMPQYCTSKLCNLYCTYEMARLIAARTDKKITINAFNPGYMPDTNLVRTEGNALSQGIMKVLSRMVGIIIGNSSTSLKSGKSLASLITDSSIEGVTGKYWDRGTEIKSSALSYHEENARELWQTSMRLCGLHENETVFSTEYSH